MAKRVLYALSTGDILQWQDTEAMSYADPGEGSGVLPVTDDQWADRELFARVVNGALVSEGSAPGPTLDQIKADKILEINAAFEQAASALTDGYTSSERLTWATQQAEALAWDANQTAPTPYLDSVALARGIPADEMRAKTRDQARLFLSESAKLVGKRQRLRDSVYAIQDGPGAAAELAAIQW
ncbi:hypothetical protein GHR37_22250 [Achromobacter xylosoxidans]|nr:hypothetical protein [Achromobacter xylosoxidans]